MNKQELTALVAELLQTMEQAPTVKGGDYKPTRPVRQLQSFDGGEDNGDLARVDLRRLYLVEGAADPEKFKKLKLTTPARLGMGRAGPRYKTLTQLRFRADHAAARDAALSQVPEDYPKSQDLLPVQTKCRDKDTYLTRPDLGRVFDQQNTKVIASLAEPAPRVQLVVGDGLSAAAILANAAPCIAALRQGLERRGICCGRGLFVRYCRVGAGDAVGDITGCEVVCVLVGERQGLATDRSMSCYITYKPHTGVSESARTVVSNIHDQGTPAREAGEFIAELVGKILEQKASGVALRK